MRGSSPRMTRRAFMTIHLETQSDLEEAVDALIKRDLRLKPVLEIEGMPALRRREPGFAGLAHIVCGQQLSTASAAAIWGRLSAALGEAIFQIWTQHGLQHRPKLEIVC